MFLVFVSRPAPQYLAGESQAVVMTTPTIVFPQQATVVLQEGPPLDLARYPSSNTPTPLLMAQAL